MFLETLVIRIVGKYMFESIFHKLRYECGVVSNLENDDIFKKTGTSDVYNIIVIEAVQTCTAKFLYTIVYWFCPLSHTIGCDFALWITPAR